MVEGRSEGVHEGGRREGVCVCAEREIRGETGGLNGLVLDGLGECGRTSCGQKAVRGANCFLTTTQF